MMTITTARLALQPVDLENATALWRIMQSAHLREFQDVPRLSREEFLRRVDGRPTRLDRRAVGRFEWLITAPGREVVGWVSLRIHDRARAVGELGYSILLPFRRRGYASEATGGVVDETFRRGILDRIQACCIPGNVGSRGVLQRLGFAEERLLRRGAVVRGRPVDVLLFTLDRSTWASRRASALAGR
jgi:RimJ/RimL family protein N-acetyltransferase